VLTNIRKLLTAACVLLLFAAASRASTWEAEIGYDYGTSDTIDETDELDVDYRFNEGFIKLRRRLPPLWEYSATLGQGIRDYEEEESEDELDNTRFSLRNRLARREESKKEIYSLAFDVDYLNKSYENRPEYTYNKTGLGASYWHKIREEYKLGISGKFENIVYLKSDQRDESVESMKLSGEKYFFGEDLTLDGYSRLIYSSRSSFGTHLTNKLGLTMKIGAPHLESLACWAKAGFRNSRINEDYEDDLSYDYFFSEIKLSTVNPINDQLELAPYIVSFSKVYAGEGYDNAGYETRAMLRYYPVPKTSFGLSHTYREKTYTNVKSLSSVKNSYTFSAGFRERGEWGASSRFTRAFYQYTDADEKNEIDSIVTVELDKYLNKELSAHVRGQYKYKDMKEEPDFSLSRWDISAAYRW